MQNSQMRIYRRLLVLTLSVGLAACATTNLPKSSAPLPQPTTSPVSIPTIKPTISCSQDVPDEVLPAYPGPAPGDTAALKEWQDYSSSQFVWGVQAAGAFRREKIKRAAPVSCLRSLSTQGLIILN